MTPNTSKFINQNVRFASWTRVTRWLKAIQSRFGQLRLDDRHRRIRGSAIDMSPAERAECLETRQLLTAAVTVWGSWTFAGGTLDVALTEEDSFFEWATMSVKVSDTKYVIRPFYQFGFQEDGIQAESWQQFPSGQITKINLHGTSGNDAFQFTNSYGSSIFAALSDVAIYTFDGNDTVGIYVGTEYTAVAEMGKGNDSLSLYGAEFVQANLGAGNDSLSTWGQGDIDAGAGHDRISVGYGIVLGGAGDDHISGSRKTLTTSYFSGGPGSDHLFGTDGNDILDGGIGEYDDFLDGGLGSNEMIGLEGNDIYILGGEIGQVETIVDTAGNDTIWWNNNTRGATIDLRPGKVLVDSGNYFLDRKASIIENAVGSRFDDIIIGNAAENIIIGSKGNDNLTGGEGNDLIAGDDYFSLLHQFGADLDAGVYHSFYSGTSSGKDEINGGEGDDVIFSDPFEFRYVSDFGPLADLTDRWDYTEGGALVEMSPNAALIRQGILKGYTPLGIQSVIGGEDDKIWAGLGNDIVVSGGGADLLNGSKNVVGAGDKDKADQDLLFLTGIRIDGVTSFQIEQTFFDPRGLSFAARNANRILDSQKIQFLNNREWVEFPTAIGGQDRDVIFGSNSSDVLLGGSGDDLMFGGEGNDYLAGEQGNDYAYGQAGLDVINGDGYELTAASQMTLAKGTIRMAKREKWLIPDESKSLINAGFGNDHLFGGADFDILVGGKGNDWLHSGEDGEDEGGILVGDELLKQLDFFGGSFKPLTTMNASIETLASSMTKFAFDLMVSSKASVQRGHDRIFGDAGINVILGGSGNDIIETGGGVFDFVDGGGDVDIIHGEESQFAVLFGGEGSDQIHGAVNSNASANLILGDGFDWTGISLSKASLIPKFKLNWEDGQMASVTWAKGLIPVGKGHDTITAAAVVNFIVAGSGNDQVDAAGDLSIVLGDEISAGVQFQIAIPDITDMRSEPLTSLPQKIFQGLSTNLTIIGFSGTGNDEITATGKVNLVAAGAGNDNIDMTGRLNIGLGQDGIDYLTSRVGYGLLIGGNHDDVISGQGSSNILIGDDLSLFSSFPLKFTSFEQLFAGDFPNQTFIRSTGIGSDDILGGTGFDFILAGAGADNVQDPGGNNIVFLDEVTVNSRITSEFSRLMADFDHLLDPVTIEAATGRGLYLDATDYITQMERNPALKFNIIGSNDVFEGGSGRDIVFGGGGDDIINGNAGSDILFGQTGSNRLNGGLGSDLLFGGNLADVLDGGKGLFGDALYGGSGADFLWGRGGEDYLNGGAGEDRLVGGTEHDYMQGGIKEKDYFYIEFDSELIDLEILDAVIRKQLS